MPPISPLFQRELARRLKPAQLLKTPPRKYSFVDPSADTLSTNVQNKLDPRVRLGLQFAKSGRSLFPTSRRVKSALFTFYKPTNRDRARLHARAHIYSPPRPVNTGWFAVRRLPGVVEDRKEAATTILSGMLCTLEVVAMPTADALGACLNLNFDGKRYIFGNISEGTQRVMSSRKISLARIEHVFLTGLTDWRSTGGLMGMVLTLADIHQAIATEKHSLNLKRAAQGKEAKELHEIDHVNIHGGKNLAHMLASARGFVFRREFPLTPIEIRTDVRATKSGNVQHDWEDEKIKVWNVPVKANRPSASDLTGPSTSKNSRKRTIDSISESDGENPPAQSAANEESGSRSAEHPTQEDLDQELRLGVVRKMFGSKLADQTWHLDALTEVWIENTQGVECFVRNDDGTVKPYHGPTNPGHKVLIRKAFQSKDVPQLPSTKPCHVSMCYIVKTQRLRGKFNPTKATELGVRNVQFKLLTAGQGVPGKDGITVTPEMVMSPSPEPSGFAVVEIPDASYIDGFLARPEWKQQELMNGILAMYWNLRDPELLSDARLQSFMREHPEPKHIVMTRTGDITPIIVQGVAVETTRLNMIDDELFPKVAYSEITTSATAPNDPTLPYELGQAGAALQISPKPKFLEDRSLPEEKIMQRFTENPEILRLASEAKTRIQDPEFLAQMQEAVKDIPNLDAEIIPLGTGSAIPSKSRNVSCTLIRVPGIGSYLLDCGENTLGQLRRMYGFEGADAVIRDLRAVWISHSHADHHLGTVSVVRRFSELIPTSSSADEQRQLAVIAHPVYHHFLTEYSDVEPIGLDTHICQIANSLIPAKGESAASIHTLDDPKVLAPFGISRVVACKVDHCIDARGLALTLASGLKIAYSGDCRPSDLFASKQVGRDAHVLVHEATLDDELLEDAISKKHSTTSEALEVARKMRARNVLLTHFSQRYPKLPVINSPGAGDESDEMIGRKGVTLEAPVVFAFDFMRVRLGDFRKAREFLPALQKLYG